ncbi:MAG: hypothetical protein WCI49_07040 [Ferruginibacter sp.]
MKAFIIPSVIGLLCCCFCLKIKTEKDIPFIRLNFSYISPDKVTDTNTYSFSTSVFISYYGDYRLYELSYNKTAEVDNVLLYDSVKYDYFVHNVDSGYGYFLKNMNDSFKIRYRNDSILQRSFNGGKKYTADFMTEVKIIKSDTISASKQEQIYRYVLNDKIYDSVYLYYDERLRNIDFSFSVYRDSMANSKLCKARWFLKNPKTASYIPENFYENVAEIKLAPATNRQALINLIERYKKAEADHLFK